MGWWRHGRSASLTAGAIVFIAACTTSSGGTPTGSQFADPGKDKLAQVVTHGKLTLPTDLEYPPASYSVAGAKRSGRTLCSMDQLTGPEVVVTVGVALCLHARGVRQDLLGEEGADQIGELVVLRLAPR